MMDDQNSHASSFEAGENFFAAGPGLEQVQITVAAPDKPLAILEKLGPSPFERGGFPVIGFLATTYERVSRFALGELGVRSESDLSPERK